MDNCVNEANSEVLQKVFAHQAKTPMGTDLHVWSSGDVSLSLFPDEKLTWDKWSLVPAAMGRFMMENELKGTQFIILWHELGPIGHGQFVTSSVSRLLTTIAAANRFPDPHDMTIQSIGLTIEFYGYRGSISPIALGDCLSAVTNDVLQHMQEIQETMVMEAPSYSYSVGDVNLFLSPSENLKWSMWAFVPSWIRDFVAANGYMGTQFILLWDGYGHVGTGQLINTSSDTASKPGIGLS